MVVELSDENLAIYDKYNDTYLDMLFTKATFYMLIALFILVLIGSLCTTCFEYIKEMKRLESLELNKEDLTNDDTQE